MALVIESTLYSCFCSGFREVPFLLGAFIDLARSQIRLVLLSKKVIDISILNTNLYLPIRQ